MTLESLEEYVLETATEAYEGSGEQAPIGLMDVWGEKIEVGNTSHCMDQKHPSFTIPNGIDNTKWETLYICMSVAE